MTTVSLALPEDFDDKESQIELKGWFGGAVLGHQGKTYHLTFYDPVRLSQEIEDELRRRVVFFEPNLVVVQSVTRADMKRAAEQLIVSGEVKKLVAE